MPGSFTCDADECYEARLARLRAAAAAERAHIQRGATLAAAAAGEERAVRRRIVAERHG
jgi:hypothetical protein